MKAALYIRVSDDEQVTEGSSIEAQKTLLLKKCEAFEYTVYDFYIDDGYSAKNMRRPALTRMLKDVQNGAFGVVLFWRLDRFTRNSKDFQKMVEILQKHNAGIKSATENIDTTSAFGRFQLELTVSLAQLERETTAERVHFVMEDRHRKGLRNGAVAPYGYDLIDGELVVNPMEAEVVKRIYSIYQQNKGTRYIAKLFNKEGIPKGEGSMWADQTVYYILTNPTYCGKLRWNFRRLAGKRTGKEIIVDADHEPIIPEEEFNRVQNMREFRKKAGRAGTSQYAFTGVLRCGRCGYAMIGDSKATKYGRSRYYKCTGRFNYGVCNMPIIAERSVHESFLSIINPDSTNMAQYYVNPEVAAASDEVQLAEQLKRELDNIQKRKKKWQIAYANDVISLDELRQHTEEDRQREDYLKNQLEELPNQTKRSSFDPQEIIRQLQQLHSIWYQIDDEVAKKNFINETFSFIKIDTDVTEAKGGPGRRVPVYITDWDFNT